MADYVVALTRGIRGVRIGIAETYAFDGLSEDVLAVLNGVTSDQGSSRIGRKPSVSTAAFRKRGACQPSFR